jgi:kynureninase
MSLPDARARKPRTSASSDRSDVNGAAGTPVPAASSRLQADSLDARDPLASFRSRFVIDDPSLVYLDGNSLGRLSIDVADAVTRAVRDEWGRGLVGSWEDWVDIGTRVGDAIGIGLLGAEPGESLACDSTTVNLYKLLSAACASRPGRIDVDPREFPTDRYVAGAIATKGDGTAVVLRSVVDYRTGELADVERVTEQAHARGALVLWDCSHAVGALPLALRAVGADLAVGCSYKHIGGGPGAPAWLWVRRELHDELRQPIAGWWGQTDRFAMDEPWAPLRGIGAWASGTPNVLGLTAVAAAVDLVVEAGIDAIRAKSVALAAHAEQLADELGLDFASPREAGRRGAHVAIRHEHAAPIVLALRERGVVPDLRPPDVIRIGLSPLTTRFVDVHDGMHAIADVVATGAWRTHVDATPKVT